MNDASARSTKLEADADVHGEAGFLPPLQAWRSVAILLILYAVAMLDRQLPILMADPIRRSLHVGDFEIGLLHGFAFVLFYATCAVPLGWAADFYSRKLVIFLGVVVWSISCAACGLAGSMGQLFIARMVVGFGEAALLPAAFSLIADSFPRRQLTTAMAIFSCGGILGAGLTTAIGGIVADFANNGAMVKLPWGGALSAWQFAFCIIGAPGLLLSVLAFWIAEPRRRGNRSHNEGSNRALLGHLRAHSGFYLRHFVGFGLVMMLSYAILGWTPVALKRDFSMPMRETGPLLGAILTVTGLVALIGSGRFVDWRIGRGIADAHMRYYAYACIILAGAGVLIGLATTAWEMIALYTAICLVIPCVGIANASLQLATPHALRGRASALFILFTGILGAGLGTTITGAATDFIFRDPARIRDSLALVSIVFGPLAIWLFWRSLAPYTRAIDAARAGA